MICGKKLIESVVELIELGKEKRFTMEIPNETFDYFQGSIFTAMATNPLMVLQLVIFCWNAGYETGKVDAILDKMEITEHV